MARGRDSIRKGPLPAPKLLDFGLLRKDHPLAKVGDQLLLIISKRGSVHEARVMGWRGTLRDPYGVHV